MKQTIFTLNYKGLVPQVRELVLSRDKYTCQQCKTKLAKNKLDVHHIIPIRSGGSDKLDNLITLCRKCHRQLENWKTLNYAVPVQRNFVLIKIEIDTDKKLEKLAKLEGRTKMGEIRFLVNQELKNRRSQAV